MIVAIRESDRAAQRRRERTDDSGGRLGQQLGLHGDGEPGLESEGVGALMAPVSPRYAAEHEAEKLKWLRMEFATFCAAVIQMPCQIVKSGKRLIYRLLSWTPWQGMVLRLVERLHGCWLY